MKKIAITILIASVLVGCFTDEKGAKKTLERNGYKVMAVGGYDYFTESEDTYQTRFALGKRSTIRLDD